MARCVGIDLGTSTTCVATVDNGEPCVIPCAGTIKIVPSYIHLREDGKILIGEQAKHEAIADPFNTIWASKRLIGKLYDDDEVQDCRRNLTYKLSAAPSGRVQIDSRKGSFSPEWVASLILKFVARQASSYLNEQVRDVVLTVPGTFTKEQRQATQKAAESVGLKVMRMVNEPTAAAMSWGYHKKAGQTVAVFDFGGGTLDVSVLRIGDGGYRILSSLGEAWLGGEDFDNKLVNLLAEDFKKSYKLNLFLDKIAHQRVKDAAEQAKIELSNSEEARIYIPTICPDINRMADVDYTITRDHFEKLIGGLAQRSIEVFVESVRQAKLEMSDLDNVILVGGMTRVPLVRKMIAQALGREADSSLNPDEAVARGAAVLAASLAGEKVKIKMPASKKPDDEYLSGDVDIEAMYAAAIQNKTDETEQPAQPRVPAEYDPYTGTFQNNPAAGPWQQQQQMPHPQTPRPQTPRPQMQSPRVQQPAPQQQAQVGAEWDPQAALDNDGLPPPMPMPSAAPAQAAPSPAPAQAQAPRPAQVQAQAEGQAREKQANAQMLLEVLSQSMSGADLARLFKAGANGNGANGWVQGGFALGNGPNEEIRIKIYQNKNGSGKRALLGEFIVKTVQPNGDGHTEIRVGYSINKEAPFAVRAPSVDSRANMPGAAPKAAGQGSK